MSQVSIQGSTDILSVFQLATYTITYCVGSVLFTPTNLKIGQNQIPIYTSRVNIQTHRTQFTLPLAIISHTEWTKILTVILILDTQVLKN